MGSLSKVDYGIMSKASSTFGTNYTDLLQDINRLRNQVQEAMSMWQSGGASAFHGAFDDADD